MTLREKIQTASFSDGFEDRVMASIHQVVTLSSTIVSFGRWWIAASLIVATLSGIYLGQANGKSDTDMLTIEKQYNYIAYAAMGDLL